MGGGQRVGVEDARALAAALRRTLQQTAGVPVADKADEVGEQRGGDWQAELDTDVAGQAESLRLLMTAEGRRDVAARARFCERGAFSID